MNKKQLIDSIKDKIGDDVTKSNIENTIDAFFDSVKEALRANDTVTLIGFGTFGSKIRAERTGRNPKTGQSIVIPEAKVPYFKAGKSLKEL